MISPSGFEKLKVAIPLLELSWSLDREPAGMTREFSRMVLVGQAGIT
jgi:hypothetical protein